MQASTPELRPQSIEQGVVKYDVEVTGLQINLVAMGHAGRFLLSADRAAIVGRHVEETGRNNMTFTVQQVTFFVEA
jgi:hypothetical protein